MICKNCKEDLGAKFKGRYCPECAAQIEEEKPEFDIGKILSEVLTRLDGIDKRDAERTKRREEKEKANAEKSGDPGKRKPGIIPDLL
jgi:hypothetical protein